MSDQINNILIPNVTKLPDSKKVNDSNKLKEGSSSEFKSLLEKQAKKADGEQIKLSVHAAKRLNERDISLDGEEFFKLKSAFEKLRLKGGQDSLVVTENGAYIVDVKNSTVVTAIDKDRMNDNVFTKIDSTIFMT